MSHLVKCHCCCYCSIPFLLYTFNNHQHQPLSQNAKATIVPITFSTTQCFFSYTRLPSQPPIGWCSFLHFLTMLFGMRRCIFTFINFIFHFSLKSGIMQILNAIFYGCVGDVSAWAIFIKRRCIIYRIRNTHNLTTVIII